MRLATLRTIFRKEFLELRREPWLCGGLVLLLVLLSVGLWRGDREYRQWAARQQRLQAEAREDWLQQESRSAHEATHHGTSVYKVFSPLGAFDPGVQDLLGTQVRLESHKQQPMTDPPREEWNDPLRFQVSSPALLIQAVLPFFVILLTFSAVSREREQGTLPLVLSQGGTWRSFIVGKMAAFLAMAAVVLIPLAAYLVLTLWRMPVLAGISGDNFTLRVLGLAVGSLLFLAGWSFLSLAVSARVASSRLALIVLLGLWTGMVVIVPRVAVQMAERSAPLPDPRELLQQEQDALQFGEAGEHAYTRLYEELEQQLLKKHNVEHADDLPLNLAGAQLIAAEEFTDRLHDETRLKLERLYARQDRSVRQLSLLSPYLAMRTVSMGLAGTDRLHHESFQRAAEMYRRELVRTMNEYDMALEKPLEVEAGPEVWGLVPSFGYDFPAAGDVLQGLSLQWLMLWGWFLLTALAALTSPRDVLQRGS